MLKPIVSMNQMAMNESIATTCCYVWNGTSLTGSATVPHGGTLIAKTSTTWYQKVNYGVLSAQWTKWTHGHSTRAGNDSFPIESKGTWYWNAHFDTAHEITAANCGTYGAEWLDNGCSHTEAERGIGGPCKYFSETYYNNQIKHTGATTPHGVYTSGNEWLADHTAYQYAS